MDKRKKVDFINESLNRSGYSDRAKAQMTSEGNILYTEKLTSHSGRSYEGKTSMMGVMKFMNGEDIRKLKSLK